MGLNRVTLLGNLGQDPELKVITGGQPVLNLRLATTESYLDRDGQRQERTDWHTVVIWGKRGEALSKILHKGSQLLVEGRISTRSYEKNGEKRYATDIVATNVELCGGKRADASTGAPSGNRAGNGHAPPPAGGGDFNDMTDPGTDEIPF